MASGMTMIAGGAGAVCLARMDELESLLLGRESVYAPSPIVKVIARRWANRRLTTVGSQRLAKALRPGYGLTLAAYYERICKKLSGGPGARSLLCGATLALGELIVLPLVKATPPLSVWTKNERMLLLPHAALFFGVLELVLILQRKSSSRLTKSLRIGPIVHHSPNVKVRYTDAVRKCLV